MRWVVEIAERRPVYLVQFVEVDVRCRVGPKVVSDGIYRKMRARSAVRKDGDVLRHSVNY